MTRWKGTELLAALTFHFIALHIFRSAAGQVEFLHSLHMPCNRRASAYTLTSSRNEETFENIQHWKFTERRPLTRREPQSFAVFGAIICSLLVF